MLGASVIFALSNVGSGPTIWTTLAPAFVATIALVVVCLVIEVVGGTTVDDIVIDRDLSSGLRLGGALLGAALILGRAAGGEWTSWSQTWIDLAQLSRPIWPLAVVAGLVHRWLRPTPSNPQPLLLVYGVIPTMVLLAAGVVVVGLTPNGFEPSQW